MYNVATWPNDVKLGGVTLKAAGLVTASADGTSYYLGKGKFRIVLTWTACEVGNNDEYWNIYLEGNTRNATSTYYKIAPLGFYGAAAVTGDTVTPASGAMEVIVDNPLDYQVRYACKAGGTIGTGMNFSVIAYPLGSKE